MPVWRSHLEDVPSEGRSDDTGRSGVCATITEVRERGREEGRERGRENALFPGNHITGPPYDS